LLDEVALAAVLVMIWVTVRTASTVDEAMVNRRGT
jgi:hypothetical protein